MKKRSCANLVEEWGGLDILVEQRGDQPGGDNFATMMTRPGLGYCVIDTNVNGLFFRHETDL